jgi:hypothetical protein
LHGDFRFFRIKDRRSGLTMLVSLAVQRLMVSADRRG